MTLNKWAGILLALIITASAATLFTDSADANAGDTESDPLTWYNKTIILLPEVEAGEITDESTQVQVPPTSLLIDWGDGTFEVKEVDGYVSKGSLEVVHTYETAGDYHATCTPQNTSGETGYTYTTYELWLSIRDAPSVYFYDGDEELLSPVVATNGINVGAYKDSYFSKITKPADPVKEGYFFDCWTYNGEEFDFNTAITAPTVLQAKWEAAVSVTVDGTVEYVRNGTTVADLTVPTKDGYTFNGWYSDAEHTVPVENSTVLTDGMTLYSGWTQNSTPAAEKIKITVDGKEMTFDEGTTVADIEKPTKDGQKFDGWYSDEKCTVSVEDTTVLTNGMALYSKFTEEIPVVAIIVCMIGAIVAFVGLRYHPLILVIGAAVVVAGVADILGFIEVIR